MSKYTDIFNAIQEKVLNDTFSIEEANVLNESAYEKYADNEDKLTIEAVEIIDIDEEFTEASDAAYDEYKLIAAGIQDKYDIGEITFNEAMEINALAYDKYMTESVSPMKKHLKDLEEIKNTKPNEYDGPEDVKKFVDKNYDKLVKISETIQKEPDKLKKNEIAIAVETIVGYIGVCAALMMVPGKPVIGLFATLLWLLTLSIHSWIVYLRSHDDLAAIKQLSKTKKSLEKIKEKKLPEQYKKKIAALIQEIDDAETEIYAKLKKVD